MACISPCTGQAVDLGQYCKIHRRRLCTSWAHLSHVKVQTLFFLSTVGVFCRRWSCESPKPTWMVREEYVTSYRTPFRSEFEERETCLQCSLGRSDQDDIVCHLWSAQNPRPLYLELMLQIHVPVKRAWDCWWDLLNFQLWLYSIQSSGYRRQDWVLLSEVVAHCPYPLYPWAVPAKTCLHLKLLNIS